MDLETLLTAANGKSLKALDVFSHSMRHLKDTALGVFRESTGDDEFSVTDIKWVLTVPAIWSDAAKQFMREAAYKVRCFKKLRADCHKVEYKVSK